MKTIKKFTYIHIVILMFFVSVCKTFSQNCTILPIDNENVPTTSGQITVEFTTTGGCGGIAQQYYTGPSWITFVSGGTSWFVLSYESLPSGTSYRTGTIAITIGNYVIQNFTLTQGTPPPPPPPPACVISGFPTTITIDPLPTASLDYTLTFSNCSPEYLTFTTNGFDPLPSNNWFTITQLSNTSVRITAQPNNTSLLRSMIVVGTKPTGGAYISAQIIQDKCEQKWYPDEDADTFGNAFAAPIVSCTNPSNQYMTYVSNNSDVCPEVSGSNQGCPSGQVPENMNWIMAKTYDLNGILKASSKAYYDDLGKVIQSQSVDIKTNKTWASSILYDVQGRPALSTLSAPINNTGGFLYKPDFVRNSGNATYNNSDFETTPLSPTPIGTAANTLGAYYSTGNTGEPYQDITQYPFSRTIYSELNPGTALKAIGGNKQGGEWKHGYTFSMPAGQELSKAVAFGNASYDNIKTIKTISKDVHGNEVVVFTDTDGKILATARIGGSSYRNTEVAIGVQGQGYVDVHVPTGTTGFTMHGVSGITTQVYNLITEETTATATDNLLPGFYRVSINLKEVTRSDVITITCKENYYDYSLNEYDEVGRLIASYQPVGATKAQKPVTTYNYNALGQLVSTTSPDEGTASFKYRKDGQIRFSQNSKQLANTEFSYTNYDNLGRPIESGVYNEGSVTFANSDTILDNIDNPATTGTDEDGLPNANCSERQFTTYDYLESSDKTYLTGVHSSYGNPTFLSGNVAKTSNDHTTTYYSYDVYGRVKWIVQNISGLGAKTIDYEYDPITGSVKKVDYQKNTSSERFIHRYTYHAVDNSLIKVETSANGGTSYTTHADYEYYETGALKRIELAKISGTPLQAIDYVYNLNGQLKAINPSGTAKSGDLADLFLMQIDYNGYDYNRTQRTDIGVLSYGEDQFNGNIKGVRWNNKTLENSDKTYSYYYNKNNWLSNAVYGQYGLSGGDGSKLNIMDDAVYETGTTNLNATKSVTLLPGFHAKSGTTLTAKIVTGSPSNFQSGDYNVFDITYDANGNIRTLNRNKHTVSGQNKMDQLGYVYNPAKPNQLVRVDDAAGDVAGADDIGDQNGTNYEYNQIGQLVKNNGEGLEYVYNASGLVTEVKKNNLSLVKFSYNDRGHRVKKEIYTGSSLTRTDYYVRDASGSVMAIYEKQVNGSAVAKEYPIYGASRLGIYNRPSNHSVYQLTDHLGNVRAVVERSGSTAVALVATDYYPFGMPMPNRNIEGNYRYGYQGEFAEKEPELGSGQNSFQLRLYDSRIGRWISPDPMGQYHSPYMAMDNRPNMSTDPTGGCTNCSECPESCQEFGYGVGNPIPDGSYLNIVSGDIVKGSSIHSEVIIYGNNPDINNQLYQSVSSARFNYFQEFQKHLWMQDFYRGREEIGRGVFKIIGAAIAPLLILEAAPVALANASFASEGAAVKGVIGFAEEMAINNGSIKDVNWLGVGLSAFTTPGKSALTNEVLGASVNLTINDGLHRNENAIMDFTVGRVNNSIHNKIELVIPKDFGPTATIYGEILKSTSTIISDKAIGGF